MLIGKGLLTHIQRAFLSVFAQLPDQSHFYLTGGTALSEFYVGHRLSFDVDLFTSDDGLVLPTSYQVERLATEQGFGARVVRRFASYVEFLIARNGDELRVDLALDSPFRFQPPEPSDAGVLVNDFQDLKVDKLLAYFGRAEPRDAIDLYFLMLQEPLQPLLDLAAQKDPGFDLYWFAVALNRAAGFPDELARWPVKMLLPCDPIKLKHTFQSLADDLMRSLTASAPGAPAAYR